ncbi:MAG: hypothetical protein KJZ65_07190 [Phycisphaerales bacterium]|nr:hypothetical protein [Phycisphaerales bacterium]
MLFEDGEADDTYGPGSTLASGRGFGQCDRWALAVNAETETIGTQWLAAVEADSYTHLQNEGVCCPTSFLSATIHLAHIDFTVDQETEWAWSATVAVSCNLIYPGAESRDFAAIRTTIGNARNVLQHDAILIETAQGTASSGWEPNGLGLYEWEGQGSLFGSGFAEVQCFTGNDARFDRDGDGRFTQLDLSLVASIVGTPDATDPDELLVWDFNDDGVIDEEDVEGVQFAINAGVGAGVLGDLDQDGDIDCDDFDLLPASPNYTIGDDDHLAQLDADLDGDNDAADRAVVSEILQPADWDNDGDVDYVDTQSYLADFSAQVSAADLNGDQPWDFYDVQIWLAWVSAACP